MDMRSQFYRDISFNVFFLLYTNWYRSFFITCFLSFKVMLSLQVLSWANNTILSSELPKPISCSLSKLNHWADDKLLQFLCKEYSCAICSFLNQNPGYGTVTILKLLVLFQTWNWYTMLFSLLVLKKFKFPILHRFKPRSRGRIAFSYILAMYCNDVYCGVPIVISKCSFAYQFNFLSTELDYERVLYFEESIHKSKVGSYWFSNHIISENI